MSEDRDVILVLDDEPDMLRTLQRMLTRMGYACHTEIDPMAALERVATLMPDVLLTDLQLPGLSGLDVLRRARQVHPALVVILITAYATIETAVAAIHEGAADYVPKPFTPETLREKIEKALAIKRARERAAAMQRESAMRLGAPVVIGESPSFRAVLEHAQQIAGSEASVLLLGESGTGKEILARTIHALSPRGKAEFIPIDCSALSETLLESELFGHEKGAFTGADASRAGLLEYAEGGTVFLDEVGEIPPRLQSRLLRVLQERSFRRVGGREEHRVDIRIIAATNANLELAVKQGRFRQDLYYRLNIITLVLPPLRERRQDIAPLAHHFLMKHAGRHAQEPPRLSPDALAALEGSEWPGNVRELENAMQRAVAFKPSGTIGIGDLPPALAGVRPSQTPDRGEALDDVRRRVERAHILKVLEENAWHRGRAAAILGVSRKTLWDKMRTLGIG